MQKQCTVDLWTAGYAGSRLTASARSPMDKPWTTLCVAHRLPTGRRLPTSSTVLKPIVIKSGKVKTKTPAPALAYSSPVAVQTTGTTAHSNRKDARIISLESPGIFKTIEFNTCLLVTVKRMKQIRNKTLICNLLWRIS